MRILTNHPGQEQSPTWRKVTEYVPAFGSGVWGPLRAGLRLFRRRRHADCVVLGAGRSNTVFGILQGVVPFGRRPCIMIDCLWYRGDGPIRHRLKSWRMRLVDRSVDRYVVWASREREAYATAFGLDPRKFVFVPYHTTLDDQDLATSDEGYVFSGGNFARDYPTLLEAVRGLPLMLRIACTRPELFEGIHVPDNVEIRGYSHRAYLEKMAACRVNVVALAPGLLHSGGQQTFLNAMWLGKPTIVTDPEGARDYIRHGENGCLVEAGNPAALREAIQRLWEDPARARRVGEAARRSVRAYTTEKHFQRIVSLAAQLVEERRAGKAS